jgi:hypothetical protein
MRFPEVTTQIVVDALRYRGPAAASQLLVSLPPLATTPTSNERIRANAEAIRARGINRYA